MNILNYLNYRLARECGKRAHRKWVKDKGDYLRTKYELTTESIVFDLGGYKGDWTSEIFSRYKCNIYAFEPIKEFYQGMVNRFKDNSKIKIFKLGLADSNCECKISMDNDGSSIYKSNGEFEIMKMVKIDDFLKEQKINRIDLIKINIEGGEFNLLDYLVKTNYINNIENLLIQFHPIKEINCYYRRSDIHKKLSETHELTFEYPFIWENWCLKNRF